MIGYLKGRVVRSAPDVVVLDVGGVGYELHVPLSTFYEIEKADDGAPVGLWVRTHLREDSLTLFGFWTERERLLFDKLIGVGGIGPKLARVILSGLATDDLLAAISAGDIAKLATTPGVGKKTAERMVVELRDKVQDLVAGLSIEPAPSVDDDLVDALVSLGYKKVHAARAAAEAQEEQGDAPFHELLRVSLRKLSRA
jgi:Holliday junction DNA helicase RuvA